MPDRIVGVEITDTFGIEYRKFSPKSVTIIRGKNGSGKSSIIRAIAKVFEGGKDPSVIRRGAKKSIISLTLASGTVISKSTTAKSSNLDIQDRDGKTISAPQTYINALSEAIAIDPAKILRIDASTAAGKKELVSLLLDLMPIEFTEEEINAAISQWTGEEFAANGSRLDLAFIDKFHEGLSEKRRRIGVQARDAQGTVDSLRKVLPEQDQEDWGARLAAEQNAYRLIVKREVDEVEAVQNEARVEAEKRRSEFARAENKLREDFQRALGALSGEREKVMHTLDTVLADASAEIRNRYQQEKESAAAAVTMAQERTQQQAKAIGVRESIESWSKKCSEANGAYQRLTFALEELEKLKRQKIQSLPVPGVEFAEDRALIDGVDWQSCNLARRVEVAMQLSALRSGELNLLLLDDAEHLDTQTRQLLEQGIVDAGFQLIEARVQDGSELKIETVESGVTA